jgi:hypothetical protein
LHCVFLASAAFLCIARLGRAERDKEQEVKDLYTKLIDAENRHDLPAVRDLMWNSPSTLFVAKAPVGWHGYWGIDDVRQHPHDMYQQPFRIDQIYEEEKVVFITSEIAETYAPVRIIVVYGGQNPVPKPSRDARRYCGAAGEGHRALDANGQRRCVPLHWDFLGHLSARSKIAAGFSPPNRRYGVAVHFFGNCRVTVQIKITARWRDAVSAAARTSSEGESSRRLG